MLYYKYIQIVFGLFFTVLGAKIFFQGKHKLVGGFDPKKKGYKSDPLYAKRVGLIEFIFGVLNLLFAVLAFVLAETSGEVKAVELTMFLCGVLGTFITIALHEFLSAKDNPEPEEQKRPQNKNRSHSEKQPDRRRKK